MEAENPLDKRPTPEEILTRREIIMRRLEKRVEEDGLHLYDALHAEGIPRALFLANLGDPTIRNWLDISRSRQIVHAPGELPDLDTIKERNAAGMHQAGLGSKLEIMVALADPFTEEGQKLLMELAKLQAKLLPKQTTVRDDTQKSDISKAVAELSELRKQREALLDQQQRATDANWEKEDDAK